MEFVKTSELVTIVSKTKYLSSDELVVQRHLEVNSTSTGLKRTHVLGSSDEDKELKTSYDNLRAKLSVPRIERLSGRALAVWDDVEQAVEVLQKDGKFEHFGYSHNGKLYLESYEALFLLELGRLQLEYNGLITSVEQAYLLLLGECKNSKYDEYLIYSNLTRVGYIVTKYRNINFENFKEITRNDCIWALLRNSLNKTPIPENIRTSKLFSSVKASMSVIKAQIMQPINVEMETKHNELVSTEFRFILNKRKSDDASHLVSSNKKQCIRDDYTQSSLRHGVSLVNFLKDAPEYEKFQHIFQKFDVIQLKSHDFCTAYSRRLKVSFDLYLHNEGYSKRVLMPPKFRVIIVSNNENFPTHDEIVKCQSEQLQRNVPLLVITLSESKQIQAFIYHIS